MFENNDEQCEWHDKFHEKLISDGETTKTQYAVDGIIDIEKWKKTNIKILFVLKEPNTGNEQDADYDLIHVYKDLMAESVNSYGEMMAKITFIFNSSKKLSDSKQTDWLPYLKCASTINVKKNYGGGTADWGELYAFAKKYREDLLEQIKEINPQIIFCAGFDERRGSISEIVKDIIKPKKTSEIDLFRKFGRTICLHKFDNYYAIEGYHFAERNRKYFEDTLKACQSCRDKYFS